MALLPGDILPRTLGELLRVHKQFPLGESFAAVASFAVVAHVIFNRWEPMRVDVVSTLLLGIPMILSLLLAPHLGLVLGLAATLTFYNVTLVTSIVLYRLSPFHPLWRYPGPLMARTTQLWHAWQAHKGQQHLYLKHMHDRYGDVVRMGPNEISIRDASCIAPLYGTHGLPKGPGSTGRQMHPPELSLIGYRDTARHSARRKPWARGLGSAAVREYIPALRVRVHQLVDALAANHGQVADLAKWLSFFSYDFMGDMAFGGWTEMMRDGYDKDGFWNMIHLTLNTGAVFEQIPWLAYYVKRVPAVNQIIMRMRQLASQHAARRYAQGATTRDLFYYLSGEDLPDGSARPPRHHVTADGLLAVVGGSDTTSSALSNLFYLILGSRKAYQKLQAEVDAYYPPGEDSLDPKHHNEMPYLNAVINETLRCLPPILSGSQRAPLIGGGDVTIGPYYVPEGNQVRVHYYSVHHDPRYFSDPAAFYPERWLVAAGKLAPPDYFVHDERAFVPFSFGPSNCVGKGLALQQMRSTVVHIMAHLEMRFADGYNPAVWETQVLDKGVMVLAGPLPVVVEMRG